MSDYVHEISNEEAERIRRFGYQVAIGTALFVLLIVVAIVTAPHWVKLVSHKAEREFVEPYVGWANKHLLDSSDPVLSPTSSGWEPRWPRTWTCLRISTSRSM